MQLSTGSHTTLHPAQRTTLHTLIAACSLLILSASKPLGAVAQIHISELYPAPLSGESEWVELHNAGTEPVSLTGWTLEDQLATPSTIFVFTSHSLEPGEYLVAELPSAKLNNTGDGVVLKNNHSATVHSISYEGSSPGLSWSVAAGGGLLATSPTPGSANAPQPSPSPPVASPTPNPTTSPTPSPSPTSSPSPSPQATLSPPSPTPSTSPTASPSSSPLPTPSPTPTPTPLPLSASPTPSPTPLPLTPETEKAVLDTLSLTEVSPCPVSGQPEWIELHSTNSSTHTVTAWKITDEAGNTRYISGTFPANSYQTFSWSGSLLNNAGDSLTLSTNLGTVVAIMEYRDCQVGQTFHQHHSEWILGPPSPGQPDTLLDSLTTNQRNTPLGGISPNAAATTATGSTQDDSALTFSDELPSNNQQPTAGTPKPGQAAQAIAALSALYAKFPLPRLSPDSIQTLAFSSYPQAMQLRTPPALLLESSSVILGGLCFLLAGMLLWYVHRKTSPLRLVTRLFATIALGRSDFLSQLTKRAPGF